MINKKRGKHSNCIKKEKINNLENPKKILKDTDKNKKRKTKMKTPEQIKRRRKIKLIILGIVIILVIILGVLQAISINNFKKIMQDMSANENSIVIDSDGNTIAKIGSEKAKSTISLNEMPTNLKNAYIAIEDERFYNHCGIDIKRTGSATLSYIVHGGNSSFGGSTITQQLIKNLTGDSSSTITRKVKEWKHAITIESFMSKDEILDLYLNVIYVGPNIYGVETGSQYYFSKSVKNLTLEECAFLAGINNSPNSYNPFNNTNNSEKISNRTKTVLSKMLELGYITGDEYNNAISKIDKGLNFKKGNIDVDDAVYPYHTDALLSQLIDDISNKKHISTTFANNYIDMAGLTIYSTQDSNIQKQIETEFKKTKYQLASKTKGEHSQAAMVIIDHKTGQVTGCVGGLGEKTVSRGFNRATQSVRQTGSSIKPIAVLVPGISKKKFTGATIFSDEKTEFAGEYSPENYSNYLGDITVRRALESSQNIPFVQMMQKITPKESIKYLEKMGITTLTEKDDNLALSLGGLDKGISPLQMAGAYATIANDGVYFKPTFYTKVINKSGKIVIEANQNKKKVFSKEVAYIIKELLTEPVEGSNGTATYCSISGMDVSAKTGTTDENYDRWLCGFTPYYTCVSWYGYDQNETISYNGTKNPAGILWANVMTKIHTNLLSSKFEKPSSISKVTICSDTGGKANVGCSNTYEEYFLFGTIPSLCTIHSGSKETSNSTTNNTKTNTVIDSFDTTTKDDLDVKANETTNNKENTIKNTITNTTSTTKNNTTNNGNTNIINNINSQKQNTSSSTSTSSNISTNKENTSTTANNSNTPSSATNIEKNNSN